MTATVETLPVLVIEVSGVVRHSNLDAFKTAAMARISGIKRDLRTDADFGEAEQVVKWCSSVEDRLSAVKAHALAQTAGIAELFQAIDDISAGARAARLDLDKLIKMRKETIRGEIAASGIVALREHIAALNARIGRPLMPAIQADFAAAIKGKRSITSLEEAVQNELSRAMHSASATADRIMANLIVLKDCPEELAYDIDLLVMMKTGELTGVIDKRAEVARKAAEDRAEAERARIREEDELNRAAERQIVAAALRKHSQEPVKPAETVSFDLARERPAAGLEPAQQAAELQMMRIGDINNRIGFQMSEWFVSHAIGVEPSDMDWTGNLYSEADYMAICQGLIRHIKIVAPVASGPEFA